MIDRDRARTFVEQHGNEIDRLRLKALLDRSYPSAVPESLAALQNNDGGFAFGFRSGRPSALASTALALAWLRDLRLIESDHARRAIEFIEQRQTARGIWREGAELQQLNPPPWMDPESAAADVYTTALCASTLVLLSNNDLPADQGVAWLQTQQGRDGLLQGFKAHSSWLALPAFAAIFGHETRTTRRLVAGLGSILDDTWSGSMLASMLQSALDAEYDRRTQLVNRAWVQLEQAQQPDGSFTVDEGDDPVLATLQAIDVALRIGA